MEKKTIEVNRALEHVYDQLVDWKIQDYDDIFSKMPPHLPPTPSMLSELYRRWEERLENYKKETYEDWKRQNIPWESFDVGRLIDPDNHDADRVWKLFGEKYEKQIIEMTKLLPDSFFSLLKERLQKNPSQYYENFQKELEKNPTFGKIYQTYRKLIPVQTVCDAMRYKSATGRDYFEDSFPPSMAAKVKADPIYFHDYQMRNRANFEDMSQLHDLLSKDPIYNDFWRTVDIEKFRYKLEEKKERPYQKEFWQVTKKHFPDFEEVCPPHLFQQFQNAPVSGLFWHHSYLKNEPQSLEMLEDFKDFDLCRFEDAISRNDVFEMIEILDTRQNFDLNQPSPESGDYFLMHAARHEAYDALEFLLENGADPTLKNMWGFDVYGFAEVFENDRLIQAVAPYLPHDYDLNHELDQQAEIRQEILRIRANRKLNGLPPIDETEEIKKLLSQDRKFFVHTFLPWYEREKRMNRKEIEENNVTNIRHLHILEKKFELGKERVKELFSTIEGYSPQDEEWLHESLIREIVQDRENEKIELYNQRAQEEHRKEMRSAWDHLVDLEEDVESLEGVDLSILDEVKFKDLVYYQMEEQEYVEESGLKNELDRMNPEERKIFDKLMEDPKEAELIRDILEYNYTIKKQTEEATGPFPKTATQNTAFELMKGKDWKIFQNSEQLKPTLPSLTPEQIFQPTQTLNKFSKQTEAENFDFHLSDPDIRVPSGFKKKHPRTASFIETIAKLNQSGALDFLKSNPLPLDECD